MLVLAPVSDQPESSSLQRLEHEYSLRDELDPEWAIRALELVRYEGRPILLFADPGGDFLDRHVGQPIALTPFLRIAIALASALARLHGRGIVHKDIKPANVLVDPATGEVRLTGFGIASRLPRERQAPEPPEVIAGTLAYMAPEQTGRMNRSIDSRSDLYSLGVTFYEMLTGTLPFMAADAMEWVHCHIARQPVPPDERVAGIPGPLAAIVMKLLAKTAEDRYQTAAGLTSDLRRCLAAWEAYGHLEPFPLGGQDASDRLLIPEQLYGREREIDALLASFDRVVAHGTPELVLVSGCAGIGKSSVVHELHTVLVPPRGLFASGKFDQYKRDIPYATLAQAFQSLVRPLLGQSEATLGRWRDALRDALGPNGQLIVDLIPELEFVIGTQPPVPDLPLQDAKHRFQLVFRRFLGVFAQTEHPLALFLDDLQWLDAATLDLLEDLLTRPDVQHLMVIAAYRDNEVDSAHPLVRTLDVIRQAGAIVQEIILAPLAREDLGRLLADALHCEAERVAPLAQLVHEKTAGNPFFAIQFLAALDEEALLTFDHAAARWSWDLKRIHAKGYTDNVVDLMVGKLNRLPVETQKALQQLACLGNSAEFALLTMVYQDSKEAMHGDLWEAVRTGLVFRSEDAYRFLHDRVQEAAYSLIPEGARGAAHLRIGRLLASRTAPAEIEEKIFEIVNQLNRGSHLITSAEERE
jgi:serine/threonine protein kinase